MNARRLSERCDRRRPDSPRVTPPARGRDRRWIVVLTGLVCLVLIGSLLWRRVPMGRRVPKPPWGSPARSELPANGTPGVTTATDEVSLPPVFSPSAPPDECKSETKRMAARLVEDFPDQLDALQTSATIHWALGDMVEAARLWEKCLAMDNQFPPPYEGLGRVSLSEGDFDRAIAMFRQAIALDPANRPLTMHLAMALVHANRMHEVVTELTAFIESGPAPPMALVFLGQAYLELEEYDNARRVLEVAMHEMPDERQVHFGLQKAYNHLGQPDKAQWHKDKVAQLVDVYRRSGRGRVRKSGTPDNLISDAARAHRDAAAVYRWHGHVDEAELLWRKAAALDPKDVESRQALADLYEQTGRPRQALRVKQQLRDLARDSRSESPTPEHAAKIGTMPPE